MAGNFSNQDSFDIQELATLNEDISLDFLEQLQSQVAQSANNFSENTNDGAFFEEIQPPKEEEKQEPVVEQEAPAIEPAPAPEPVAAAPKQGKTTPKINIDDSFDDNFIKKYKAKLNKQKNAGANEETSDGKNNANSAEKSKEIGKLTSGNIIEKPIVQEHINYNDSLDYLDDNIKYSKYVIYIDPENAEFIESLTVKERKNLINRILKEQEDVVLTKKRFNLVQDIIKHTIIAIITIAVSIPVIYYTINASLEASINNYRNSQSIFKTLYKENGKIQTNTKSH